MTESAPLSLESLTAILRKLGCAQLLVKRLAENDNCKQQIYLGPGFAALNLFPYGNVTPRPGLKDPTFHAKVDLHWIDAEGKVEQAKGAKLVLYPAYPEVRLSGFLKGCRLAPSEYLQPIPKARRKYNNSPDGRVMFFGVTPSGRVYTLLALPRSALAHDFERRRESSEFTQAGIFWTRQLIVGVAEGRLELLRRLKEINAAGWHSSRRLDSSGNVLAYSARNGGGFTLEALLGIRPNSRAEPDFLGWEIKTFTQNRITLMTPEPDSGIYREKGFEHFMRHFGRYNKDRDRFDFTGTHRFNVWQGTSDQLLLLRGFNLLSKKIVDVAGGIEIWDRKGRLTAAWSFAQLIEHWGKKHNAAAYVRCEGTSDPRSYRYLSPVLLAEGTEFAHFLDAIADGAVVYDPGCKLEAASTAKPKRKPRNQFRIHRKFLSKLYAKLESVDLNG